MRQSVRSGLAALLVFGVSSMALAQQTPTGTGKAAAPATRPAGPALTKEQQAKLNEPLATVNGEKITRAQFLTLISQYPIPPGSEQSAYTTGIDLLINTRLLTQFLQQNRVPADTAEIDKIIDEQRKSFTENGTSLEAALADSNTTIDQMRETIKTTLQWREFVKKTATDSTLKAYMEANKDVFNGTQVRASHIQLNLEPTATAAQKAAAKEKLLKIKKEVESGTIGFADAANKYSEDPSNKEQPSGGDLRWFPRKVFSEPFSAAAFSLPKGKISDPVETEYGMHLIQVTDRKDGGPVQFERFREKILNQYAVDEQNRIVAEMRKKAKIEIKPMPSDLFAAKPADAAPKAKDAAPKAK
ncbi:MAG: parvulin-like peptidyl-prolyl isomerase [Planctomycetota bacterium]|nr:parvulin-like peptidyl-prolyl isomerase [Planctomycetota bacterium]